MANAAPVAAERPAWTGAPRAGHGEVGCTGRGEAVFQTRRLKRLGGGRRCYKHGVSNMVFQTAGRGPWCFKWHWDSQLRMTLIVWGKQCGASKGHECHRASGPELLKKRLPCCCRCTR
eukprot:221289-Chlamydomonas_euryale.AAC.5